ncbi:hypothetical protein SDC9_145142 [bioreactor metagenome]|uniref:Uncharacterized protein n=1 Tax=bioreactor metagenome TaxID=1076179 RepID=A0A645E950_9ZZZZ
MTVDQARAQMRVEQQAPEVELDMQAFRDTLGMKTMGTLNKQAAQRAKSTASQGIKDIAADANFVGTLPSEGNAIGKLARMRMMEVSTPQTGIGEGATGNVGMKGDPGKLQIDWDKHDLKITWNDYQTPVITVEPKPSVSVEMIQEPQVQITVVEMSIPPEVGVAMDQLA